MPASVKPLDDSAAWALAAIRTRRPLVHCLTNAVTMSRVADALAALGALPVMASAPEEAAEMVGHAGALLLNLGTPSAATWTTARDIGRRARDLQVPVVVDPVGCGSTGWRTEGARRLVADIRPWVVQGNTPEIAALAGLSYTGAALRGVTAVTRAGGTDDDLSGLATAASRTLDGSVVLATGSRNALSDGVRTLCHTTDVPVLASVVGGGDVLGAVVAACCAVDLEPFDAAWAGLQLFSGAAQTAGADGAGPGAFWTRFIDALAGAGSEGPPAPHSQEAEGLAARLAGFWGSR